MNKLSYDKGGVSPSFMYLCFIVLLFTSESCSIIYGYSKIEKLDLSIIDKFCNQFSNEIDGCFSLDSNYLPRLKRKIYSEASLRSLVQPLQVHYFEKGMNTSNLSNCYAPGLLNLNWTDGVRFDQFPPLTHINYMDTLNLDDYIELTGIHLIPDSEHIVIIVWSNIFKNKSKDLVNLIINHKKKFQDKAKLYFINADIIYLD